MAAGEVELELTWQGDLRFAGRSGEVIVLLDSASMAGPSPVQSLAFALAGCMAIDVVHILAKGRAGLAGLTARLVGERAQQDPRRLVKVDLHFELRGSVARDRVERAIELSRGKYCSVWHSLRPDIDLRTSFEVRP